MLDINVNLDGRAVLVTGAAGFIGHHLADRLCRERPDVRVVGLDNMSDYYDVRLKEARLARLGTHPNFTFVRGSIADRTLLTRVFETHRPAAVVNLAAQAGVRYSIECPDAYIESNIVGFYNLLEACRHADGLAHLVYASSSSVYGGSDKVPFSTEDRVDSPVSLYAATKKSDELLAYAYSKLYDIPATGLRFFTVYGPMGRPDMAYFSFADRLRTGERIRLFNYGDCRRDFTYVDDVVEAVARVLLRAPERRAGADGLPEAPHALYNVGNSHPERLMDFVRVLAEELARAGALPEGFDPEAHWELVPMQPGDVAATCADAAPLERDFGFRPRTPLREGLRRFAEWYAEYRG